MYSQFMMHGRKKTLSSTLLYGIKVFCFTVYFLRISVTVNTTG